MKLLISGYANREALSVQSWAVEEGKSQRISGVSQANASYCILGDGLLFAVDEREGNSAVELFSREGDGFALCDRLDVPGGELCHLAYAPSQKTLLGACYGTGNIFAAQVVPEEKRFGEMMQLYRQGKGEERLPGRSRAHCVVLNQGENQVFSANIALDRIYLYSLEGGKLTETGFIQLPKGVGPRHLILREDMHKIYIITEYSSEIIILNLEKTGVQNMARISTLQQDFRGTSYGSTISFSPDSRFLYAGNRGENTIAVFRVSGKGELTDQASFGCGGDWPRDFSLVENGRYVAVANQESGDISLLPRDEKTGALGAPVCCIAMDQAACVLEDTGQGV